MSRIKQEVWSFHREIRGASFLDNVILYVFTAAYWSMRIAIRLIVGKTRRDIFFVRHRLDFTTFMYLLLRCGGMQNQLLLKVHVPNHDYRFYCRVNRDDFLFMTKHEAEILEYFKPKQGDIVVDVGAHIGRYTILASKRVGLNGKVIAIEPDPMNFEILTRNISLNKLQNVTAKSCAAYSEEKQLKLFLPEQGSGRTIYNTVMQERTVHQSNYIVISAATLDSILQPLTAGKVNWMKIDVEGAEYEVLKGAREVFANSREITLIVEFHSSALYQQLIEFLKLHNFKIVYENISESGNWGHIVATNFRSMMA